jgi:hypothetical protein
VLLLEVPIRSNDEYISEYISEIISLEREGSRDLDDGRLRNSYQSILITISKWVAMKLI